MSDLISREEALMALTGVNLPNDRDKLIALFDNRIKALTTVEPQEHTDEKFDELMKQYKHLRKYASDLETKLSVEQTEWISVKDRLPEETGEYLVYTDSDEVFVEPYDEWQADFGYWYEEFSEETGGKIGEEWRSADDNCMKVVAWMPLPSPYKGDEDEH